MKNNDKDENAYKTIGEVAKELNLINKNTGKLNTHTIRFWETQFKQIKPTIKAGNRRYYSSKNIKMLIHIKTLLKDRGLTISGVKKILAQNHIESIDRSSNFSVYSHRGKSKSIIKNKLKNISKIIKDLKKLKDG